MAQYYLGACHRFFSGSVEDRERKKWPRDYGTAETNDQAQRKQSKEFEYHLGVVPAVSNRPDH
jgi:hypothetical protein